MHSEPGRSDREDQALARHLLAVALRLGCQAGLDYHRRQDYAVQFAETLFCNRHNHLIRYRQGQLPERWLRRCARYALINFLRREAVIRSHETPWPQMEDDVVNVTPVEYACAAPSPCDRLLQQEQQERMEAIVAQLPPDLRLLFYQRFVAGRSVAELAARRGCKASTLYKRLERARRQVYARWKEEEVLNEISLSRPHGRGDGKQGPQQDEVRLLPKPF